MCKFIKGDCDSCDDVTVSLYIGYLVFDNLFSVTGVTLSQAVTLLSTRN